MITSKRRDSVLLVRFVLLLAAAAATTGCHSMGKHHSHRAAAPSPFSSENQKEIRTELASLAEGVVPNATPVKTEAASDVKIAATEAPASIGRKISGGNAPDTSVKVQELSDGELLITPKALQAAGPATPTLHAVPVAHRETTPREPLKKLKGLESSHIELSSPNETPLIFDIPVTYNERVRVWIRYFQNEGRTTFKNWLERSSRFLPVLQYELDRAGLPQDLVYVAMIESGFVSHAASHAGAKGMWQFIVPTAQRYHLNIDWWIDERQDFHKSTLAAIRYMSDLYRQFNSWYLVAASYNMGEGGVRRLIQRYGTNNFWDLAERGVLPQETTDYVPKIIAAMLISKAPALYGFRDLDYQMPLAFESVTVPGGTDIVNLAGFLGVSEKYLKDLNPELIKGFIPKSVRGHKIRIPKGSVLAVSQFIRLQASNN